MKYKYIYIYIIYLCEKTTLVMRRHLLSKKKKNIEWFLFEVFYIFFVKKKVKALVGSRLVHVFFVPFTT